MTRALIADPDRDCADSMAMFLAANGIEARAVYDGLSALTTACAWKPSSAVLDLYMPRLSGLKAAQALRAKFGREIQLVAYTAWPAREAKARALEAGFDAFITKPSTPEDLLMLVSPEVRLTIERGMEVAARQLHLQMTLYGTYLDKAESMPERFFARDVKRLVEERLQRLSDRIQRQTIPGEVRDGLIDQLEALRRRLYPPQP
ncbi:MAG TPA: response regulator [Usitatibacter sp.]|nr:response regulator [Usitatibacter sp.]